MRTQRYSVYSRKRGWIMCSAWYPPVRVEHVSPNSFHLWWRNANERVFAFWDHPWPKSMARRKCRWTARTQKTVTRKLPNKPSTFLGLPPSFARSYSVSSRACDYFHISPRSNNKFSVRPASFIILCVSCRRLRTLCLNIFDGANDATQFFCLVSLVNYWRRGSRTMFHVMINWLTNTFFDVYV